MSEIKKSLFSSFDVEKKPSELYIFTITKSFSLRSVNFFNSSVDYVDSSSPEAAPPLSALRTLPQRGYPFPKGALDTGYTYILYYSSINKGAE